MSTYNLDFSEPLKGGFTIAPGAFNGPGGSLSATSLRLYGRGALEWGEAVNEDLARLAENFAGASGPLDPIGGQMWMRQKLYVRDTAVALPSPGAGDSAPAAAGAFYRFKFARNAYGTSVGDGDQWYTSDDLAPNTFSVTVYNGLISAYGSGSTLGEYVYCLTSSKLYRWDSAFSQADAAWMEREFTTLATNPNSPLVFPQQDLVVWDEFAQAWVSPQVVSVSAGVQPTNPSVGNIWWNTSDVLNYNKGMYVWDGTQWIAVAVLGTGYPNNDVLNMGGNIITGIDAPVDDSDAANKQYVDEATDAAALQLTLDSVYVNVTGDTMSGALVLPVQTYPDVVNTNQSATKGYVNEALTTLGVGAGGAAVAVYTTGSPTYKSGDIYVQAGRIYIANAAGTGAPTGGGWKQVFPAQYS